MARERSERRVRQARVEITTRMSPELAERVRRAAEVNGVTVNDMMCRLIEGSSACTDDEIERLERRARQMARDLLDTALDQLTQDSQRREEEVAA